MAVDCSKSYLIELKGTDRYSLSFWPAIQDIIAAIFKTWWEMVFVITIRDPIKNIVLTSLVLKQVTLCRSCSHFRPTEHCGSVFAVHTLTDDQIILKQPNTKLSFGVRNFSLNILFAYNRATLLRLYVQGFSFWPILMMSLPISYKIASMCTPQWKTKFIYLVSLSGKCVDKLPLCLPSH